MEHNIYSEIASIQSLDEIAKVAAVATARLTLVKEQQQQQLSAPDQTIALTDDHVRQIKNAVDVACACGINSLIIGNDSIRGIDVGQSVTIINNGANGLPFTSIATAEAPVLKQTLDTVADLADRVSEVRISGDKVKLRFSGKLNGIKATLQYQCAPVNRIKAPGSINDTFDTMIQVGTLYDRINIRKVDLIRLKSDASGVNLEVHYYPHVINYPLHAEPTEKPISTHYNRVLLKLLRLYRGLPFQVGSKGVLKTNINGLDVFVLPLAPGYRGDTRSEYESLT